MLYDELEGPVGITSGAVPEIRKDLMSLVDPNISIWNRFAMYIEEITGIKQDPNKLRIAILCGDVVLSKYNRKEKKDNDETD